MCEMKVIGYPVGLDSAEYDRNRLMFNLCFVCDAKMRTIQYEPIVRKLANYLTTLEVSSTSGATSQLSPQRFFLY